MSLKDKLALFREKKHELVMKSTNYELGVSTPKSTELNAEGLSSLKETLATLKQKPSYPISFSVPMNAFADQIHLIIMLDISISMQGTENDIYEGIKKLCQKHREDNVLLTWVVFNDEMKIIYKEQPISSVVPRIIEPSGRTDLNKTIYEMIRSYGNKKDSKNLFVTISDGEDTINKYRNNNNKVTEDQVATLMGRVSPELNDFYFLGESDERFQSKENVMERALALGFNREKIEVFTREGAGNTLNFEVISNMIDDLLSTGTIRPNWNEPIREHYLSLTDKRRR